MCRGLQQGFRDEQFGAPPSLPPSASASEVVQRLQELLDIMVARGFALKVWPSFMISCACEAHQRLHELLDIMVARGFALKVCGPLE